MILNRGFLGLIVILSLQGGLAVAAEKPVFQIVLQDGAVEIRDYPTLVIAEVTVTGD